MESLGAKQENRTGMGTIEQDGSDDAEMTLLTVGAGHTYMTIKQITK